MLKGFKDFIMRGNVVDLAVAVVIGAAFGSLVTSVVDGLINPLIAAIFGAHDISGVMAFTINGSTFSIGLILQALINFLAVAAAVYFLIVTPLNKLAAMRKKDEPAPDEPVAPTEIALLTEIRDALQAQK
ncbi:large conductance mechanosensitive channel protein MscL [Demequina gelatinilytica]|uniref:large conductance mechanosensitive channel protein MscL n=1 Tax=Demequina gelatinilytica TaxID=1638980 RepID=UPI0007829590|nr:large conductance mechanosensitive channel protein MscL [Demequina gelatinilytica]